MKRFINFIAVFGLAVLFSCQDKINVDSVTASYPPGILTVYPLVSVKIGDFPLKAILVDGASSPLKSGTLTLKDGSDNVLYTVTKDIAGTKDSIVVAANTFNASSLQLGSYTLDVSATDTQGNVTSKSYPFKISLTQYPANNSEMYLAGEFNNWGSTPMTLVSDFTWQVSVDLIGKTFKIKNKQDWSDKNYGDDNCTGIASTSGGNISCGSSGPVIVTFNDKTLSYSIKSAVTYKTSLSGLYLLGDFNEFNGSNYKFQLVADDKWELSSVRLIPGTQFKFSEASSFKGKNFGDSGTPGTSVLYGPNITWTGSDGYYKIGFNELSLKYTMTQVAPAPPVPTTLMITGDDFGWSNSASPSPSQVFTQIATGVFRITVSLNSGKGYLLIPVPGSWDHKFGGTAKMGGPILYDSDVPGSNTPTPDVSGNYEIDVNFNTNQYSLLKVN